MKKTRTPRRATVKEAVAALVEAGVNPYHIRYDRRNDVVYAVEGQSEGDTVNQRAKLKTAWDKAKVKL